MNRTVVITGASRGLGLALACQFINQGDVVFGISRTKRHWNAAYNLVSNSKHLILTCADISRETVVKNFLAKIKKQTNHIDILINNAGYGGVLSRIEDLKLAEFRKHLDQNLLSAFLMCKYFIPRMRRQKSGLIFNIASMAGKRAVPRLVAYSASKFGILALTQAIAKENLDTPIKCITVCPGGMNTKMRSDLFGKEDAIRQQSVDFVASIVLQITNNKIRLETGSDITIRHSKVADIHVPPTN